MRTLIVLLAIVLASCLGKDCEGREREVQQQVQYCEECYKLCDASTQTERQLCMCNMCPTCTSSCSLDAAVDALDAGTALDVGLLDMGIPQCDLQGSCEFPESCERCCNIYTPLEECVTWCGLRQC